MIKFNYAISNPPYQIDNQGKDASRRTTTDIFPAYQKFGNFVSHKTIMIYPATWQKSITFGLGDYLVRNGLYRSTYFNSDIVFPNIQSGFPLSIVECWNNYSGSIKVNNEVNLNRNSPVWIDSVIKEKLYNYTGSYPKLNSGAIYLNHLKNIRDAGVVFSNSAEDFTDAVKVYIKREPGVQADADDYFMSRDDYIKFERIPNSLSGYKVAIQSRTIGRTHLFNELVNSGGLLNAKIFEPDHGFSNTYVQLGSFNTIEEAYNFQRYVNTRFFLLLTAFDYSRIGYATFVPDLLDYSHNNSKIDWGKGMNEILMDYFNISSEDIGIL